MVIIWFEECWILLCNFCNNCDFFDLIGILFVNVKIVCFCVIDLFRVMLFMVKSEVINVMVIYVYGFFFVKVVVI